MKNIFNTAEAAEVIDRINHLTASTQSTWGEMDVAQMLAHCNVTYEMLYSDKHAKPTGILKLLLKIFVKKTVVGEKAYAKNGKTAPAFLIASEKDFEAEKTRLVDFINKTQQLGEAHFDNKESHSFGKLTKTEWNNMFYKHLDHHLNQFGV